METMPVLGRNILSLRKKLNLSQEDLASFLEIQSREIISYYENGTRNIPIEIAQRISDLFGVELYDLLSEDLSKNTAELAFAFRADEVKLEDLVILSEFKKIVKNYLQILRLESKNEITGLPDQEMCI